MSKKFYEHISGDTKVFCKDCDWKGQFKDVSHYILGTCCPMCHGQIVTTKKRGAAAERR